MKHWSKYIKPYLPFFIIGPLCMIVEVIGEMLMPKLLSLIIDYGIGEKGKEEAGSIVRWIYDLFGGSSPFIIAIAVGMIITAALMMIGGVGGAYFGAKAAVFFAADLRADIYKKIQQFSSKNIDKFSAASLVTRLTNDVTQLQNFINMMLRMCLRAPGMMIGGVIMAISLNPSLALIIAVVLPMIIITLFIIGKKGFPLFTAMQTKIDNLNSNVRENITNMRVVKSFVRESYETDKFHVSNSELKKAGLSAVGLLILISPIMTFFINAANISVLWFGGNMLIDGAMSTGELTAFVTYMAQILSSLIMVAVMIITMSRAIASGNRIIEVLDEKIDITDDDLNAEDNQREISDGGIEFKNVSFRYYKNSEEKVIDNVSLKIKAGQTVGIIGSTGSGKTTLVSMISRMYDCDEGEILIDGVNIKKYSLYHLREGIGSVLQKNVLFSGTIKENLQWGNDNADYAEIEKAAEAAQANGFITSFKDGYDTVLDQGGTNVSGGQKQRLCIARAILKNPKIIILDDSTSAVDTATETRIRGTFKNELKQSTKIIIAQRISSVIEADVIFVMNEGRITGNGTHDQLIENNKEYREIYYSQIGKGEANNGSENS